MDFLNDVQRWIKNDGLLYIKGMGIKKGQTIVDFGCNTGHYTIPAARVAGPHGKVYAIDREQTAVDQLMKSAQAEAPGNIIPVISHKPFIDLPVVSADAVLIYDVLHYLNPVERKNLFQSAYTVLKDAGILSVFPKHSRSDRPRWHLEKLSVSDVVKEIRRCNFDILEWQEKRIIHDDRIEAGTIINFRKSKDRSIYNE
jgi:ubiquinone/menaquinone biosynthesis C-methylase UbiE